ncbi:MAG TPA: hypothetical protein DEB39_17120 [Planctomycetaceae bacterium]|nr:hypothetical protein [Planctomycetaceae bacterium]
MIKMSEFDPVQDAEMLIGKFISREIDEEEGMRLLTFLKDNPGWDQKLYEQKYLADLLAETSRGPTQELSEVDEVKSELLDELYRHYEKVSDFSHNSKGRWRTLTILLACSAGILVLVITALVHAFFFIPKFSHPTQVTVLAPFTETSQAVAVLSYSVDVKWSESMESAPQVGAAMLTGTYDFQSGVVMTKFYCGATLIAQGPCRMEIVSGEHVSCFQGRFSVETTDSTNPFHLSSRDFSSIKGKKFLLDLSRNEPELHSLSEATESIRTDSTQSIKLHAGKGIRIEKTGRETSISADGTGYLSSDRVVALAESVAARNLERWKKSREEWLRDPSLCLFFDFQSETDIRKTGRVTNLAASHTGAPGSATLVGGRLGDGRWPGKNSLEFRTVSDRLLVSIPERLTDITLSVSLRADEIERNLNSIFMTEAFGKGALHWQILNNIDNGERGAVRLGLCEGRPGKFQADNFDAPVVFNAETLGTWVRLAMVLDTERRTVSHYLDGKLLVRYDVPFEMHIDLNKAEMGNWSSDTPVNPIRNFVGCFEEFMLFSRALSDDEVGLLHLAIP